MLRGYKGKMIQQQKGGAPRSAAFLLGCGQLEIKTKAQLHAARIVRAAQVHEVAAR
jgi:hypothetical protein